jgi:peptidoglycan/LPS O-acetylase OafA/YrhL
MGDGDRSRTDTSFALLSALGERLAGSNPCYLAALDLKTRRHRAPVETQHCSQEEPRRVASRADQSSEAIGVGTSTRLPSLDALRGIAAFWVVLHHCWASSAAAIALGPALRFTPLRLFWGARPPVIFFFVLSGFVLALPHLRGKRPSYFSFVVQRACRIYLPFAASILLSLAAAILLAAGPTSGATAFFDDIWSGVSPGLVGAHLLMTGVIGETNLDSPMWSLVQEMRISVVFPLLVTVALAAGWKRTVLAGAGVFGAAWWSLHHLGQDEFGYYAAVSSAASGLLTVYFLLPFVIGITLAINRDTLVRAIRNVGPLGKAALWAAAASALLAPPLSAGLDALYSLGAGLLIALVLSTPAAATALGVSPLQWLGRISYSLYLIHIPVLAAAVHLLRPHLPLEWIIALTPLLSVLAAQAMFRLVEAPSIRLGRRLAGLAGRGVRLRLAVPPALQKMATPLMAQRGGDAPADTSSRG